MTQHEYPGSAPVSAAADRISATLDSLAEALLGADVTRQPVTVLRRRTDGPSAPLFDVWLAPNGPGQVALPGLGTLVRGDSPRPAGSGPAASASGTVRRLLARYGHAPVRGLGGADGPLDATAFQLPVSSEPSAAQLRPVFAAPLAELAAGQQTLTPAELPTGNGVQIRLLVPPAFHALTVQGGDEALAEQLGEVADELFASAKTPVRRDWAVIGATLTEEIAAAGVRYAGLAALEIDGQPSNASLVVALGHSPAPITQLAADLANSRPQAEVWTVILPSGPAAVLVQGRTAAVPGTLTPDGTRRWTVTSVVQAFLPLPDGVSVLTVQLGTARGEDWELYAGIFADLLRSIELGWDGEDARPSATVSVPLPAQVQTAVPPRPTAMPPLPADFNPFAATAEVPEPAAPQSTPYPLLPADFNPFAP